MHNCRIYHQCAQWICFVVTCLFALHRRPHIRFLFIGSPLFSALLSAPPRGECYFTLALRCYFTSLRLLKAVSPSSTRNMLGIHETGSVPTSPSSWHDPIRL